MVGRRRVRLCPPADADAGRVDREVDPYADPYRGAEWRALVRSSAQLAYSNARFRSRR